MLITHTGIAAGVGRVFSRVCLFVCLSVIQYAAVLPAAVDGVGLHVDTTAYVF